MYPLAFSEPPAYSDLDVRARAGTSQQYVNLIGCIHQLTLDAVLRDDIGTDPEGLSFVKGGQKYIEYENGDKLMMSEFGIKYPDASISTTFLIEGIAVKYRHTAGTVKYHSDGNPYADSVNFATIGIPFARYEWFQDQIEMNFKERVI
ncbi:hypothetical protein DFQ28_003087 [Apophysomyces sp. BC1034]|nr:hypothetical protein DFQ29_002307 [Apophysomyces sp. BC1021]KAG0189694.1 hypothetical protein DFQ28_003087 [Apophysomyces sp. BC1034]